MCEISSRFFFSQDYQKKYRDKKGGYWNSRTCIDQRLDKIFLKWLYDLSLRTSLLLWVVKSLSCHDITEILLKVALNTIKPNQPIKSLSQSGEEKKVVWRFEISVISWQDNDLTTHSSNEVRKLKSYNHFFFF
jgi:hypothetical protein